MFKESIGLIGGFGAYATLHFYQRILEELSTGKERDYPHIYMDNDFTMPSRTRALLYGEEYETVVNMITESVRKMCILNADYIVLICGTAHAFLPDVYKSVPEAERKILNIISILGDYMIRAKFSEALVIAAEGTLKNRIYEERLKEKVKFLSPSPEEFDEIRYFIEAIKTNSIEQETYNRWIKFLKKFNNHVVVLGCTELPVLIDKLGKYDKEKLLKDYVFLDPLELTLQEIKRILK